MYLKLLSMEACTFRIGCCEDRFMILMVDVFASFFLSDFLLCLILLLNGMLYIIKHLPCDQISFIEGISHSDFVVSRI
jgi:hypothetical protein